MEALASVTALAAPAVERTARDRDALPREVAAAKKLFCLAADAPGRSCYEPGRDGFWGHRSPNAARVRTVVVDPASIDVNRRARRSKTDGLDAGKLVAMLMQAHSGEARVGKQGSDISREKPMAWTSDRAEISEPGREATPSRWAVVAALPPRHLAVVTRLREGFTQTEVAAMALDRRR